MSRNYKFKNPDGVYFVTSTIIHWIDIFLDFKNKNLISYSTKQNLSECSEPPINSIELF